MSRLRSSGRGERFEQDAGNGVIPSLDREVTHGGPRYWWETRAFVAAMILLAAVPLLYPALPPLLWWFGLNGAGWHALLQSAVIAASLLLSFRVAVRRYKRGELTVAAV